MADESCFTPKDALRLVQGRAADALNVKLMKCGGIGPALEIAAIAASAEVACAVGCMMAVSYTHLDVYKETVHQVRGSARKGAFGHSLSPVESRRVAGAIMVWPSPVRGRETR